MKNLLVISILAAALAACGSKPAPSTTPANKTTDTKKTDGSMGGAGYAGSAMKPAPTTGGDPCAN